MIPDPSSPIPRYHKAADGVYAADGAWCQWADVEARLAQLAQEQATLRHERDRETELRRRADEHVRILREALDEKPYADEYDTLAAELETAEAALGETRQALHQLYLAARQTLSALDGVDLSGGTTIWIKERERLDAALARVDDLLSQRPA